MQIYIQMHRIKILSTNKYPLSGEDANLKIELVEEDKNLIFSQKVVRYNELGRMRQKI